jgi:DNA-binding NtrC family response regulator
VRFESSPEANPPAWRRCLVGESPALQRICGLIEKAGPRKANVLITGESGAGKEMAARALHAAGPRATRPFVAVNCAAIPETLLEAELFGHTRGAFTGAQTAREGYFSQAHTGTLFLDEIGEIPLAMQAKLLRVLQEQEFQKLGSSEVIRVDVRIIAATNARLPERIRQGSFREDLYYRLNIIPLALPSLAERSEDIPALLHHFVGRACRNEGLATKVLAPELVQRLARLSWPGNIRELANCVERAVALSGDRPELCMDDFLLDHSDPAEDLSPALLSLEQALRLALPEEGLSLEDCLENMEGNLIRAALARANGNKSEAARLLNVKRTTLGARMRSLGMAA